MARVRLRYRVVTYGAEPRRVRSWLNTAALGLWLGVGRRVAIGSRLDHNAHRLYRITSLSDLHT